MTPRELIDAFEVVAEAPDGVKRLRELVLQLAVRGKLVPQAPADEPASVLLDTSRKSSHWRETDRPRGKPPLNATTASLANVTLHGWDHCPMGDCLELINGRAYAQHELLASGTPVIRIQNLNRGTNWYYSDLTLPVRQYCTRGDLLFAWSASFGPYFWEGERAIFHYHIWKVVPSPAIDRRFAFHLLQHLTEEVRAESHGLAMLHMTKAKMEQWPIALPPLAEQHRIVARVDELMGLLDRLEAARKDRDATREAARDSALAALRDADTPDEVEVAWNRIAERMPALFTRPADLEPLRQAVLQLAVRGRLVRQDPDDEPAISAVRRARSEILGLPSVRGRAATMERIDGDAALSVGPPSDSNVPSRWCIARLSDVTRLESGHTPDRDISAYWGGPFKWVGIRDARAHRGGAIYDTEATITQAGIDNSATRLLPAGTVCLSRTASVGYSVVLAEPMCTSQDFVNFICTSAISPRYLQTVFVAERPALLRFAKGAVHLTVYFPEVKAFHVRLPPLAEQHRIVAKVDALMALIDQLEARLTAVTDLHAQFAAAAVHHLDA